MSFTDRIVIEFPLNQLWIDETLLYVKRASYLTKADIKNILKKHAIAFVLADIGKPLEWIKLSDCYRIWKSELEKYIADNPEHINLNEFPNGYAFIASKWIGTNQEDIILFEKVH